MRTHVAALAAFLLAVTVALAIFFHRPILYGEVFAPADLLYSFYPWAYDGPRIEPSNASRSDEVAYHQPLMITHFSRLKGGDFPEWDPLTLSGAPAFFQGLNVGLAFSPLSLPFYLLPPAAAVTVYAPLRLFCAAFFMWCFLRYAGLRSAAAVIGAVAFGLNGAFVVWLSAPMPTIALFLPLALLAVERLRRRPSTANAALLALVLGVQFTGAYLPTSLVLLCTVLAYAAVQLPGPHATRSAVLTAAALVLALAVAAVALVPMFANLLSSPAAARSMADVHLPPENLATFAMPDFWGSPVNHTWWYRGTGNYPEFVTYLGVSVVILAGAGLGASWHRGDRRSIFFAGLAAFVLLVMYGVPPATWTQQLPGLRQMNVLRWNVALALGVAWFAACGLQALLDQDPRVGGRRLAIAGAVGAFLVLAGAAFYGLTQELPAIRLRNLQDHEKRQLFRFLAVAAATLVLVGLGTRRRAAETAPRRGGALLATAAVSIVILDLVLAGWRFNPTLPPERAYPWTPALAYLGRPEIATRVLPVGDADEFLQGHVWSVFGIATPTGFDFHGDWAYQQFLALALGVRPQPARWDYVDAPARVQPNPDLLALLDVGLIVTPPTDARAKGGGFATAGELTDGRTVVQTFEPTRDGLRRVDVLTATFERRNEGTLTLRIVETSTGEVVAERTVPADRVPNNDWLSLAFPPRPSRRREFQIELRATGAGTGTAVTAWTSETDAYPNGYLSLDGERTVRDLQFRTFADAPDRWPGTHLVYSEDLNIYRNESARGRAWFVSDVVRLPLDQHLAHLADPPFELGTIAVLDANAPAVAPDPRARVTGIDLSVPDERRIEVDAPAGGLLVVSERHHPGWSAAVDGIPTTLLRADAVLMAVRVPPGGRQVRLVFRTPGLRSSMIVSGLAVAFCLALIVVDYRRARCLRALEGAPTISEVSAGPLND